MKTKTKNNLRNICIVLTLLFSLIIISSLASANIQLLCLTNGQKALFSKCNPNIHDRTCTSTSCQYCVNQISPGIFCPSNFNACNSQGTCLTDNSTSALDHQAPQITINSPSQNQIITSRSALLDIDLNEVGEISYYDNINGRGKWTRICSKCDSYSKKRSFNEGFNNLTIKAVDLLGNPGEKELTFFIDSKKPKILKTEPKGGFASGEFTIEFQEDNPSSLQLIIINEQDAANTTDINISHDCILDKNKYACSIQKDISQYTNQQIQYYAVITDIAGNSVSSRPLKLKVDTSTPIINSISQLVNGRRVELTIDVTETNLDKITFIDNFDIHPRERTICSSLKNGLCIKSLSLSSGTHDLTIIVRDDADNLVAQDLSITI